MNAAVSAAYAKYTAAISTLHKEIAEIYPVGSRVRMTKGNRVRQGTVTQVSCHFVQIKFDDGRKPVWKNARNETVDPE